MIVGLLYSNKMKTQTENKPINKCECCLRKRTLNKFKWLDDKTLLCYECADRIGKSSIWKKDGMTEAIRLQRISYRLEGVLTKVRF